MRGLTGKRPIAYNFLIHQVARWRLNLPSLSVEHCTRRAERYRLRIFATKDPAVAARLLDISHKYRQLAGDAHEALRGARPTNGQTQNDLYFLRQTGH